MGAVQIPNTKVQLTGGVSLSPATPRLSAVRTQLAEVGVSLNFPAPVPPQPPGPNDLLVPAPDGFVSLTTPHTSATGNIIVRVFARNNAASSPNLQATWNGVAMTKCGQIDNAQVGGPVCAIFAIRAGATGTNNIAVTCASGSAGSGALRIGSVSQLGNPFLGVTDGDVTNNYYYEAVMNGRVAGSNITLVAGCVSANASPFSADPDITQQWNASAAYMSAFFGNSFRPVNADNYFVVFPASAQLGASLGVEFLGLVP